MNKNINGSLGGRLKQARSHKGWSLDRAGAETGVSKAMLGQIERGESSPTIVRLWSIANGFELPLSYFLTDLEVTKTPDLMKNEESDIEVVTLFPFDKETGMETFQIILAPGREYLSAPHNKGVIEHIIVVSGSMEYFLNKRWKHLAEGQVVKFGANRQHGYRNLSQSPTKIHNIICYKSLDR
ncbi:transcriptional regulator, XRE family with cupin sensor [Shewanella psychrophila]|uniref:Transcriptional regulator, XRE family with cupin sensor n=1 Tax=Shewanella psychrophila TaxID=225848 RepID=A0A1S6HQE9_9GAMM|nr:XRE family transcriptional regulator [Shewanella psychrophila]AQS37739.1 transcriptional regulator, XRE family with cupin sensor [Shewanella psychrophila]